MLNIRRPVEYLIYLGVPLLIYLFSTPSSIFFTLLTVDSMFSAINFIRSFLFTRLSEAKIVYESNCLYSVSTSRRYIYYAAITTVYLSLCRILWVDRLELVKLVIFYTASPPILKLFSDSLLRPFFQHIEYEQRRLIRQVVCDQLAQFLEFFSSQYLGRRVRVAAKELQRIFIGYDLALSHVLELTKSIAAISVSRYLKKHYSRMYYQLMKTVYTFKTGNHLESFSLNQSQTVILQVIEKHDWKRLLEPEVCEAIIQIYQFQEDQVNLWNLFTVQLNYKLISMFSVLTICKFVGWVPAIAVVNLGIRWLRKGRKMFEGEESWLKIGFVLLSIPVAIYSQSMYLGAFFAEFGYLLLVNQVTVGLRDRLFSLGVRLLAITHHQLEYQQFLVFTLLYFTSIGYLDQFTFYMSMINLAYLCLNLDDRFKQFVVGFVTVTGFFSDYHYLHLLHNIYFCFIVSNWIAFLKRGGRHPRVERLEEWLNKSLPQIYYLGRRLVEKPPTSLPKTLPPLPDSPVEEETPVGLDQLIRDRYF